MIIFIIAPNVKSGGGLELLIYLVEYLRNNYSNIKFKVYLDESIDIIQPCSNIEIINLKGSLKKIKLFSKKINNALYFGNLPPLVKSKNSIVYLHNSYLLMPFKKLFNTSIKFFIKYTLQQLYIKFFIKNVDIVACQNTDVKNEFKDKYNFQDVYSLPFFRLCDKKLLKIIEKKYDFCYISLAYPHKNHLKLLEACDMLSDENISFSLVLTIEDSHIDLIEKINLINQKKVVKIINLGKISKKEVCKIYSQSKCQIFPSTKETFGLGLVESVGMDLDVLASDLDYVFQSIEPSLVFDPNSCVDISLKMKQYLKDDVKKSKVKIENEIDKLINILIKGKNV